MAIEYDPSNYGEDKIRMFGKLKDTGEGITNIGSYIRSVDFQKRKIESEYFALNESAQGHGIGKRMLAANIALYQKLGLDRVKTHANIDVGGYAWARYGYAPTRSSWDELGGYIETKIDGLSGAEGYAPADWEELSERQQERVRQAWQEHTRDEFYDSEVEELARQRAGAP